MTKTGLLVGTVLFIQTVAGLQINIGADPYLLDVLKQEVRRLGRDDVNIVGLSDGKRQQMYDKIIHAHSLATHKRIHAIIGRYDTAVAMATEKLKMAYMLTASATGVQSPNVFHLVPRKADVAQAFVDVITYYEWEKIGVFYDNEFGMSLLERLITRSDVTVKAWRVSPDSRDPLREWLIQMRKLWIQKVVVFCNKHKIHTIVRMARNLAMISSPYEWAFYNTDGEYWDTFSMFEELQSNVTIVSLMTLGKAQQTSAANELAKALGRDALWAILRSAEHISRSDRGDDEHLRTAIVSHLPTVRFDGQSGHLQFDEQGLRRNISLQVSRITDDEPRTIGYWTSEMYSNSSHFTLGLQLLPNASTAFPLKGIPVAVVMILEEPFTRRKRDHEVRIGNDRFEGFAVDLLEEIAKMLDFKYNIYLVNDGKFGAKDPDTGEWNGIIGELLAGNATMSVAPLSINSDREEAVDFTKPFMTRYVTVLMKASIPESSYFEFLNPLSEKVWLCTFGAFVGVSVVLYLLERFGHTRGKKKRQHMSLRESFWFIFGSLLQGNTDDSPSTVPGRILTSSWWFFALILISSYTANLAAFLTVKKINTPINSVTDLAQQNKIKYGTVLDSGVMSFFKNTKVEHFAKMWAKMSEVDPDSMVTSTAEGYNKVSKGGYAFFWDNTVNRYRTTVDCSYMEIGPAFDAKGFGIGVPPGAAYREELSMAILRLSDTGKLFEMENKYWGSRDCPSDKAVQPEETSELQIENVAGVFFIIVGGIILATVIGLCEKFFAVIRGSLNSEKREEAESYK